MLDLFHETSTRELKEMHQAYTNILETGFSRVSVYDCIYIKGKQIPITKAFVVDFLGSVETELVMREMFDRP